MSNEKTKVTMTLTSNDVKNADHVLKWSGARSKAAAIGKALSLSSALIDELEAGKEIYVKNENGQLERLIITNG